ncbi:uroporphyrinogen decarboxylase [Alphaproteobacteria bacterium]|nr:uroporphyrinogen decarboxylase [Alphaproteobacteria bacterium]
MNKIINVLKHKIAQKNPPIWIMRQAGRYLPEYLETRAKINNFLDLCYNPQLACEVTLQPIRRFDFDCAIIFSDILVIPDALGVKVDFVKNHGPILSEFDLTKDLSKLNLNNLKNHLKPVFEAINLTKASLNKDKVLIGFAGAPWTLACYMIEGSGSKNFEKIRQISLQQPEFFEQLITILTQAVSDFLSLQIQAGVDIVKIFDSWAGILPSSELEKWVIKPAQKIVENLQRKFPNIPVIYFPKNIGFNYEEFYKKVQPDCLALDQNVNLKWAKEVLQNQNQAVIQGNLDNFILAFGTAEQIKLEVNKILNNFNDKPFIFNLGHGILPQTPIKNVELLLKLVRN